MSAKGRDRRCRARVQCVFWCAGGRQVGGWAGSWGMRPGCRGEGRSARTGICRQWGATEGSLSEHGPR